MPRTKKPRLLLTVRIEGKTMSDLLLALDEVRKAVDAGYYSGANSNDDGEYSFTRKGEEEETLQP